MKRLFTDRARLVVYVEAGDLNRLTEKARSEGKMVVEWAREVLLGELEASADVSRTKSVRVAERRASRRNGGTVGAIEDLTHETFRNISGGDVEAVECSGAVSAFQSIKPLGGMASDDHDTSCQCGVCNFKRSVLKGR